MLFALTAARDKINTATDLPGRLLIVGSGSHKSLVTDMATRRSQAFADAHTGSFEPLATLVFSRIAALQVRGLYAAGTLASFSESLGREISANDMTPAIDKLGAGEPHRSQGPRQFRARKR